MSRSPSIPELKVVLGGKNDEAASSMDRPQPAASETQPPGAAPTGNQRRLFGRFELLFELGRGGMASLYLARLRGPETFEKLVAIKKIHEHLSHEEEFVRMFLDEARIAALIHHPNVAAIFDMGQIDGSYYIAMEYVHGQTLNDLLRLASSGPPDRLPWTQAVRIVADSAAGLHAAHTLQSATGTPLHVVHRDVSPQNLIISFDGHVKVVDFGIAYAAEKLTHTGASIVKGKVGYMSPEQTYKGRIDHRADIFSLGIVLYEATTLRRLFQEETDAATLLRVRAAAVQPPRSVNPDLPPELERIILKALSKSPDNRFETAEEMSEALDALLVKQGEVVGRKQLAGLMDGLFHDQRRIRDHQIRLSVQLPGRRADPETTPEPATNQTQAEPQGSGVARFAVLLAVGLAVGLGVLLALVLWPRETSPPAPNRGAAPAKPRPTTPPGPTPQVTPRVMTEPRSSVVTIRVEVRPARARAEVTLGDQKIRGTRLQFETARSTRPQLLQVRARGYKPHERTVVPVRDRQLTVELERLPRKKRRQKKHRPSSMLFELPD